MSRPIVLTLMLSAATMLAAQPQPYTGPVQQRDWPGAGTNPRFTQSVAGLFSGAGYPDVVVLKGGTPHMLTAPSVINTLAPIYGAPTDCTSMVTLYHERAASGYRRDQLVVSCSTGLRRWARTANPQWVDLAGTALGPAWANMPQMMAVDLNADGFEDLVGRDASAHKVLVCLGSATGFNTGYARTFAAADSVFALTATRWDADAMSEIAVATASGLTIYDYTLTTAIAAVANTSCGGALLASPRSPGLPGDDLLVLATYNGGSWSLFNVTSTTPAAIDLGALDLVACAVGDANGDGWDDLVFSKRSNQRSTFFLQVPGLLFSYLPYTTLEIPLVGDINDWAASAGPAPRNQASPLWCDFTGKGAADFLQPVEDTGRLAIARTAPGVLPAIGIQHETTKISGAIETFGLDLGLTFQGLPAQATHIEVATCEVDVGDVFGRKYRFTGYHSYARVPVPAGSIHAHGFGESAFALGSAMLLQLRPIRVTTAGGTASVERVWPPTVALFAPNEFVSQQNIIPLGNGTYLATMTTALGCCVDSFTAMRTSGDPSQAGSGRGSSGKGSAKAKTSEDADGLDRDANEHGGGGGPSTNGGVETGIIIIVTPPPPPDPPAGSGGGATGPG